MVEARLPQISQKYWFSFPPLHWYGWISQLFIYLFIIIIIIFFIIESKLFQLEEEEEEEEQGGRGGRNFFFLKIFERGKYFMQSVFMGKNA